MATKAFVISYQISSGMCGINKTYTFKNGVV